MYEWAVIRAQSPIWWGLPDPAIRQSMLSIPAMFRFGT